MEFSVRFLYFLHFLVTQVTVSSTGCEDWNSHFPISAQQECPGNAEIPFLAMLSAVLVSMIMSCGWFIPWSFSLVKFCFIFINLPSNSYWNTVGLPWLVLPIASWICWPSYRHRYVVLLVLLLLLLWNFGLSLNDSLSYWYYFD